MSDREAADIADISGFRFDRAGRRLVNPEGRVVPLSSKAFDTLAHLVARPGHVVERRELLAAVWPGVLVEENNLNQAISALRRALGDDRDEPRFIATVQGRGYQLVAPVRAVASGASPTAGGAKGAERFSLPRRWRVAAALAAAAVATAALVPLTAAVTTGTTAAATSAPPASVSHQVNPVLARGAAVAVTPFADLADGGDAGRVADGLTRAVRLSLQQVERLDVAAGASSDVFGNGEADVRTIGEALGVAFVIQGAQDIGVDRMRVTVEAADARTGFQVWSQSYERALSGDVLAAQAGIAREIADDFSARLEVGLAPASWTGDADAYALVLRAQAEMRSGDPDRLARAAELFRAATERDPDYAVAWSGLLDALASTISYFPDRAAGPAQELDAILAQLSSDAGGAANPSLAREHRFAAAAAHNDLAAARSLYETAALTEPAWRLARMKQGLDRLAGRPADAVGFWRETVRANPLDPRASALLQSLLYAAGDIDGAEAEYRRGRSLLGLRTANEAAATLLALNEGYDRDVVAERYARYRASLPAGARAGSFDVLAALDDREAALEGLRRELARHPDPTAASPQWIAWWADYWRDSDLAIDATRVWLAQPETMDGLFSPMLADMRRDPRFKDLARELGLVDYWRQTGEWSHFCRAAGENDFECS